MAEFKETGGTGAANVAGFQIPLGIRQRKRKVDELLQLHEDIGKGAALLYLSSLDEGGTARVCESLDQLDYQSVAEAMRDHAIRELIRTRVREIVRKKAGGGGYVLYAPNQGKKKHPKPVGNFPTKLGAKRAELARFPPQDSGKLARLRREVDRLLKDPKKRAEREKTASREKGTDKGVPPPPPEKKSKKEMITKEIHDRITIARIIRESVLREALFKEEQTGSEWDEYIGKISSKALTGDKKFQKLQKNIEARTQSTLEGAFAYVGKAVKKFAKVKSFGVKRSETNGKTYLAFSAAFDGAEVAPIYIYVENGLPKLEFSDQARVSLTRLDPDDAKLFRAELITLQERVLDEMDDLVKTIHARDKYLAKVESEVDRYVAGLSGLQVSLLKNLLVKKYRKIS